MHRGWSQKKFEAIPSRKHEVFPKTWKNLFSPADDQSRFKLPRQEKVVVLEPGKKSRGGIYMTIDEGVPNREEPIVPRS